MILIKKYKTVFILMLFVMCIIAGWFFYQNKNVSVPQYATATATLRDLQDTVLAGGQVHAEELVDVGAQATGRVNKLYVQLGQRVQKGDVIAEIDASQQENALKDEEAHYRSLLAQHDTRKIQLAQMQTEFNSLKQTYEGGVTSKLDFLKAQNALKNAQNDLKVSQSQLEQARLKIQTAKTNLSYARITAPIEGIVVSVVTKQGQTINAMQSSPTIVRLAKMDTVQIKAKFSEADVPKLKTGMKAHFQILGLPSKQFDATLDALELAPIGEIGSGAVYYYGWLNVPNPKHELFIGMTANVTVLIEQKNQVLTIPSNALGKSLGNNRFEVKVMHESADKAIPEIELREIEIGLNNKVDVEVLSGLQAGDKVVVTESDGVVETLGELEF